MTPVAERRDPPGAFVALVDRQRPTAFGGVELAAPGVQVRAADVGQRHLDQRRARLGLRDRVLLDLKRLSVAIEHGGATSGCHRVTSISALDQPDQTRPRGRSKRWATIDRRQHWIRSERPSRSIKTRNENSTTPGTACRLAGQPAPRSVVSPECAAVMISFRDQLKQKQPDLGEWSC